jgi:hypothetical protein
MLVSAVVWFPPPPMQLPRHRRANEQLRQRSTVVAAIPAVPATVTQIGDRERQGEEREGGGGRYRRRPSAVRHVCANKMLPLPPLLLRMQLRWQKRKKEGMQHTIQRQGGNEGLPSETTLDGGGQTHRYPQHPGWLCCDASPSAGKEYCWRWTALLLPLPPSHERQGWYPKTSVGRCGSLAVVEKSCSP